MIKSYLIQRGMFSINTNKNGIDRYVRFDYMGSAEFEFGALGFQSLKKIRENQSKYQLLRLKVNGIPISVFSQYSEQEMQEYLDALALGEFKTKEYTDFDNFVFKKYHIQKTDFWWNISADFMFWAGGIGNLENNFLKVLLPE